MTATPIITRTDRQRLRRWVRHLKLNSRVARDQLTAMARRLKDARITDAHEIPRNVVTVNSRVVLREMDSTERVICTLVYPHDAGMFDDRLSVTSPAGLALLGRCVGQIVSWKLGPRTRRYRIHSILYQPEAAGNFCL